MDGKINASEVAGVIIYIYIYIVKKIDNVPSRLHVLGQLMCGVCIYIYVYYIYVYVYIYVCVYIYIYLCISISIDLSICLCTYIYIYIYIHTYIHRAYKWLKRHLLFLFCNISEFFLILSSD